MQASYWAAPLNCWRMTRWLTSGLSPRHDMNLGFFRMHAACPEHKLEVKLRFQRSKLVLAAIQNFVSFSITHDYSVPKDLL